jgi:hypothetical protein
MITIFENIYADKPHYISVSQALQRIKNGKSRANIEEIRSTLDKAKADTLKRQLPSICFSGKFTERKDEKLIEHSGFIVLDFDNVEDIDVKMADMQGYEFIHAAWLSPRGNGLKALVKIADKTKHREHFEALREVFPDADRSGINQSRVCYESWDENIYINPKVAPFTKIKTVERVELKQQVEQEQEVFNKLMKWITNTGNAFVKGERNLFIFKLASACARFGISELVAASLILMECQVSNDFTKGECMKAIHSAYKANRSLIGSAAFERDVLVEKITRQEIKIDATIFDQTIKPKDVIYGADVKAEAFSIYKYGYQTIYGINVPQIDQHYKPKRGDITLLTGIGNYGKSGFLKWYMLMRIVSYGEKFACFVPEDNPPHRYYHDFTEVLLGCDCSNDNPNKPKEEVYSNAYDFVSKNIFFIYPKDLAPTPDYVKERFLELIIKEKADWCIIDPFNQMTNDYNKTAGRSDKYLETVLADFSRFAQSNNIFFIVVAHPHMLQKGKDGNYPCPDVFDVNDGAMWNNKMDNILVYHRPFMQTDPKNPLAEFHSKKIRDQKVVGKKGFILFDYHWQNRRFVVEGIDYMQRAVNEKGYTFLKEQAVMSYKPEPQITLSQEDIDDFSYGVEDRTNEI